MLELQGTQEVLIVCDDPETAALPLGDADVVCPLFIGHRQRVKSSSQSHTLVEEKGSRLKSKCSLVCINWCQFNQC